jgi:transposase
MRNNNVTVPIRCSTCLVNCASALVCSIFLAKFKAVNNRDKNFTAAKMARRLAEIEAAIGRYMAEMDGADAAEPAGATRIEHLQEKLAALHVHMAELNVIAEQLRAAPDSQVSLTDPDARSMNSRGSGIVGYNVQAAVDAEHHLIIAHEVVTTGSDRGQLSAMSKAAKDAIGSERLDVVADRGYYNGPEVLTCETTGISAHVVKPITSNAVADGRFGKDDFSYDASCDSYRCPTGEELTHRSTANEDGQVIRLYWTNGCGACALKAVAPPAARDAYGAGSTSMCSKRWKSGLPDGLSSCGSGDLPSSTSSARSKAGWEQRTS